MIRTTIKNLLAVILLSVFTFGTGTFCYGQSESITEIIDGLQSNLPISLGSIGEITDISISDGKLLLTCSVNEEFVDIPALQKDPSLINANMKQWLAGSSAETDFIFDELGSAGLGLKVLYIGKTSGERVSYELSNSEIKDRKTLTADYNPKKTLDLQIAMAKAQLSSTEGEGITCTDIVRKGKYVIYYYLCDESTYDIKLMKKILPTLKAMAVNEVNSNDVAITQFRRSCKNAGVGIAYYYIGKKSGKTAKVRIPLKDLR